MIVICPDAHEQGAHTHARRVRDEETRHGQPGWVATLTPFSVDGMIVAASTTLLAESRSGRRGGALLWTLLVAGSIASLAAGVAVAEPTLIGRVIAAWPSFALTASYELLTRQVRRNAGADRSAGERPGKPQPGPSDAGTGQGPGPGPDAPQSVPTAPGPVPGHGAGFRADVAAPGVAVGAAEPGS